MCRTDLWNAINQYCVACGGSPATCVYRNGERQRAVVAVEKSVCETVERAAVAHTKRMEMIHEVVMAHFFGKNPEGLSPGQSAKIAMETIRGIIGEGWPEEYETPWSNDSADHNLRHLEWEKSRDGEFAGEGGSKAEKEVGGAGCSPPSPSSRDQK